MHTSPLRATDAQPKQRIRRGCLVLERRLCVRHARTYSADQPPITTLPDDAPICPEATEFKPLFVRHRSRLDTQDPTRVGGRPHAPCFIAVFASITEATRHATAVSAATGLTLLGRPVATTCIVAAALRSPCGLGCSTCSGHKVFNLAAECTRPDVFAA